jgi:hypothetical protein
MVNWSYHPCTDDGDCIPWICTALRANESMGSDCNYKHAVSYPMDWTRFRTVKQADSKILLCYIRLTARNTNGKLATN